MMSLSMSVTVATYLNLIETGDGGGVTNHFLSKTVEILFLTYLSLVRFVGVSCV